MYDLAIIGGGPAGLTSGIYAGRSNLRTVVIDKGFPGGQMQLSSLEVDNYPGFNHTTGQELSDAMYQHMLRFGAEWLQAEVESLQLEGEVKTINLVGQDPIKTKAVIIASGAQPAKLKVPGELELTGHGVSYCATCDGAFFRDKEVIVVGGGDTAIEEAIFLTRFASSVKIVHRRDKLRAQPLLQERVFAHEKMDIIWDSVVEEIIGENRVTQVKLKNVKTGTTQSLDVDGVFIYIGYDPNTRYLADTGIVNERGYIDTDATSMETSIPGVFAAGDVREGSRRQIVTATSDGAIAAMSVYHYLESL